MTGLCEVHGISRKTGYKWVARYEAGGWDALADASRAPHEPAHRMPAATAAAIIALRRAHRELGPKKLRAVLEREHPEQAWPAPSTIGDLLRREELIIDRRRRDPSPRRRCRTIFGASTSRAGSARATAGAAIR